MSPRGDRGDRAHKLVDAVCTKTAKPLRVFENQPSFRYPALFVKAGPP